MAAGNDPLTSVWAMTAAIEPGFRMIDGSLVRELYILAGDPGTAATIEPGPRLIDTTLLKNLALMIPDATLAQAFVNQMPGQRLIDGTSFKDLALEVTAEDETEPEPPPDENGEDGDENGEPEPPPENGGGEVTTRAVQRTAGLPPQTRSQTQRRRQRRRQP